MLGEKNIIVRKSLSETTMCPQTFIVKTLIIKNMHSHHIYMKWKEGVSVQDSGEIERKREREGAWIVANRGSIGCKNGCWKNGPFEISQD